MIKIIADSGADIPKAIAEDLGIEILPFVINIDGQQIVADKDLKPEDFYSMVQSCEEIPTTSQMSPADLEDIYRGIGTDKTIIHITISAKGSAR